MRTTHGISKRFLAELVRGSGYCQVHRVLRRRRADYRVFILEYHDVGPESSTREGSIPVSLLKRHIDHLRRRQLDPCSLSEATRKISSGAPLSSDQVVFTFDDGYVGNYLHAWPVLRANKVRPCIFLTTGFLDGNELWFERARRLLKSGFKSQEQDLQDSPGSVSSILRDLSPATDIDSLIERMKYLKPSYRQQLLDEIERQLPETIGNPSQPLSWDQVRLMQGEGAEFGSHTDTHPILSTIPHTEQLAEIERSRNRLESETGIKNRLFAYPNGAKGDFTERTIEILRSLRFKAACTTIRGSNASGCNLLDLKRIGVGSDSPALLELKLTPLYGKLRSSV